MARTGFHRAHLAVEMSRSGPEASLLVPISHWLGLDRWVAIEARVHVSLGGFSFAPSFAAR